MRGALGGVEGEVDDLESEGRGARGERLERGNGRAGARGVQGEEDVERREGREMLAEGVERGGARERLRERVRGAEADLAREGER